MPRNESQDAGSVRVFLAYCINALDIIYSTTYTTYGEAASGVLCAMESAHVVRRVAHYMHIGGAIVCWYVLWFWGNDTPLFARLRLKYPLPLYAVVRPRAA